MEDVKKDVAFRFYSVLKDEDAPPYLSDSLIVAADGLGGSGATVHHVDKEKFAPIREHILKAAFSDMDLEGGALEPEYLEELLESMIDDKDDTSALWASRIAIARFVYALNSENEKYSPENLAKEEVRAELCKFVRKGLFDTAKYFDLKVERSGFSLLPTTLCAYRYVEEEKLVRAEAMWAGDSRLYAFTKDGLRLISRDDEDASGAITNKFDAEEKKTVRLHREVYELEKPCVLMAVSDGIFDPFSPDDNFGVENIFLETLMEAESVEAMACALSEKYDAIRGDDATVSFKAFGFDSLEALREAYTDRANYICELKKKSIESKKVLEVMNGDPEEYTGYVRQRATDKYDAICKEIVGAVERGSDDIVTRMPIIAPLDAEQERAEAEARREAALEAAFPIGMAKLEEALLASDADVLGAIRKGVKNDKILRVTGALSHIEEQEKKIESLAKRCDKALEKRTARIEGCKSDVLEKLELLKAALPDAATEPKPTSDAFQKAANKLRFAWKMAELIECGVKDEMQYPNPTMKIVREAIAEMKICSEAKQELKSAEGGLLICKTNYENAIKALVAYIGSRERLMECFDYEKIKHLGFEPEAKGFAPESPAKRVERILSTQKAAVVDAIVEALAKDYEKTSIVDIYFNKARLERFREYYKTQNIPMDTFVALDEEIKALADEYLTVKPIVE